LRRNTFSPMGNRTTTSVLQRSSLAMPASSINWKSLVLTTPDDEEEVETVDTTHRHHIKSTDKTKKEEEIARASIVCSFRGGAGDPRRRNRRSCYIRGRGRRAMESWRREKRAATKKIKQKEEMKYALFSLDFDTPRALEPMSFSDNVFRGPETNNNTVPEDSLELLDLFADHNMVSLVNEGSSATTGQEMHGEQIAQSKEWQHEMEDLFATHSNQHRKNRLTRASF
jgi:hypothetical protein